MPDREKVIKGLECCCSDCNRELCPYSKCGDCEGTLLYDAHALLKAQQPRVMTLEELDDLRGRGRAVWFEDRDAFAKCQDVFFVCASGIHAYFKGETYSMLKMVDGYEKSWRCWTSRPTDEQKGATPWETGTLNGEK